MATVYTNAPRMYVRTLSILFCRNDVTVQNLGVTIIYYSLTFTIKLYVTVSLAQRGFLAPSVSYHKGCCLNFPFWLNNFKPVERKYIYIYFFLFKK